MEMVVVMVKGSVGGAVVSQWVVALGSQGVEAHVARRFGSLCFDFGSKRGLV